MSVELSVIDKAKEQFELACKEASTLTLVNNFGAAFTAVHVVKMLRDALTDEVMQEVFMPLMNTKIGFLTDRSGRPNKRGEVQKPYDILVVRDAIIDAVSIGLLPVGNQLNIIAERMYPTKEGYTALLRKLGVKYFISYGLDNGSNPKFAEIPTTVNYEENGERKKFTISCPVKKDDYSSYDQLKGKAERKAKKQLYEYLTGCDFGDADESSSSIDAEYEDVSDKVKSDIAENANKSTISMEGKTHSPEPVQQKDTKTDCDAKPSVVGEQPIPDMFNQK